MSFLDKIKKRQNPKRRQVNVFHVEDPWTQYEKDPNAKVCWKCGFPMVPARFYKTVGTSVWNCTNKYCPNNPDNILKEQGIRNIDDVLPYNPRRLYSLDWNPRDVNRKVY